MFAVTVRVGREGDDEAGSERVEDVVDVGVVVDVGSGGLEKRSGENLGEGEGADGLGEGRKVHDTGRGTDVLKPLR